LAIVVATAPGPLAVLVPRGSAAGLAIEATRIVAGAVGVAAGVVVVQLQTGALGTLVAAGAQDLVAGYVVVCVLQFGNTIGGVLRGQWGVLGMLLLVVLLVVLVGVEVLLLVLQLIAGLHVGLLLHLYQLDHIVLQLHDVGQCGLVAYVQQHFGRHRASAHHLVILLGFLAHFFS